MTPTYNELQQENRYLKNILNEYSDRGVTLIQGLDDVDKARAWLGKGCRPQTAKMLLALIGAFGMAVSRETMISVISEAADMKLLDVIRSHLRSHLTARGHPRSVKVIHGVGSYIDSDDCNAIRKAIYG